MRVRNWNPNRYDEKFIGIGMDRLREGAEAVADEIRKQCPVGTITRPMYKTGPYAGLPWTSRDSGRLKGSIRVVEKKERWGFEVERRRNIRVYVGHYLAWYAAIVEFYTPFVRPAWGTALPKVKNITGVSKRSSANARGYAHAKGRAYSSKDLIQSYQEPSLSWIT